MQPQAYPFDVKIGIFPFLMKDNYYVAFLMYGESYMLTVHAQNVQKLNHAVTLIKRGPVQ